MNAVASPSGATLEALRLSEGYAALGDAFTERRNPTALPDPYLVAFNPDVADLTGLDPAQANRPEFLRLAAGCARFGAVEPFAAVYAGHQFGTFVPQLGDGRAITLAELTTPAGDVFEWQVKGAGLTAFSRFGDGRAVLRSTIREYLCSEAVAALGIPTTRALAIAASKEPVYRERPETAAVLTRIAPSHLRFGTFEFFHARGRHDAVRRLADYAIARFYPELVTIGDEAERYASFLRAIVVRTAELIAAWQAVGFAHGVMNTDNMSILGLTLDYGPFGFLDAYEAGFICNHSDDTGRYSFERQPTVGLWNCAALAGALSSLVSKAAAESALDAYEPTFRARYLTLLRAKFGFFETHDDDLALYVGCFELLERNAVDYTNFFRALAAEERDDAARPSALARMFEHRAAFLEWRGRYRERLAREKRSDAERAALQRGANPKFVLRNYLAQRAIEAALESDYSEISRLHAVLRRPFDEQPERESYAAPPPDSARDITVSCSS